MTTVVRLKYVHMLKMNALWLIRLSLQALVSVSVTHMYRVWSSSSQAVCCGKPCEWAWQWVAHLVGSGEAV